VYCDRNLESTWELKLGYVREILCMFVYCFDEHTLSCS